MLLPVPSAATRSIRLVKALSVTTPVGPGIGSRVRLSVEEPTSSWSPEIGTSPSPTVTPMVAGGAVAGVRMPARVSVARLSGERSSWKPSQTWR